MKIYLDIDGVILTKNKQVANYADEFIKHLVSNHDVYWLTTRCKGDSQCTLDSLARYFKPETIEFLKKIKPTDWKTWKTEAIDFHNDFLWFDDQAFEEEKRILKLNNRYDSWIKVNLIDNPDQLRALTRT